MRRAAPARVAAGLAAIHVIWMLAGVQRFAAGAYLGASTLLDDFGITAAAAGLLAAVYFPIYGAVQIPAGVLSDLRSPRRILLASAILLFLSSAAFALAPTFESAVVARAIVGLSSGFIWLPSLRVFLVAGRERYSRLIGALVVAGNVGGMIGLLATPLLLQVTSWRWATLLTVAPALPLALLFLLAPLPEVERSTRKLWRPIARGFRSAFACLGNLHFWPAFLVSLIWNGAHFGLATWLPRYARDVLGLEGAAVGTLAALIPIGLMVSGYPAGWLYQRLGRRGHLLFYGPAGVYTLLLTLLACAASGRAPAPLVFACVFALGLLFSAFFLSMSLVVHVVPADRLGAATGLLNGASFGPAFITPWLMGYVLDQVDRPTSATWTYSPTAFGAAFGVLAVSVGLALVGAWLLRQRAERFADRAAHR